MVTHIGVSFRISGWFKHPLISTPTCFYWFGCAVSWIHWHFPPSYSKCKLCSTSTNFFLHSLNFPLWVWSLVMQNQLSCHYQLWSINLKEEKEETPTQGSPSQPTLPDKENTHLSDTSSAPRVCSCPEDLSLQGGTQGCHNWVCMDPPRAAFRQSFGGEGH